MELNGASVVVTGASRGIGRVTAERLAQHGAALTLVGRDVDALSEVARQTGGTPLAVDVADPSHADRVVGAALEQHGRLDAIVANAGIGYFGAFSDMPVERIDALLAVNLHAPLLLARAAIPHLLQRPSAAIVIVGSIAGAVPVANEAVYSATKAALESFTDALREELRETAVTVSIVRPGVVETGFFATRGTPYDRTFPPLIPAERVAGAVVDLMRTGGRHRTEPRWMGIAPRLRAHVPRIYQAIARSMA